MGWGVSSSSTFAIQHPSIQTNSEDMAIEEFHLQGGSIRPYEWLALITLCFAPFAAHILVGLAPTVMTCTSPPPWHARINLYNPIVILWRYLMVADRRLRCRPGQWTPALMAVTSVVFWTAKGWDGSAAHMRRHKLLLIRPPPRNTVDILSAPMLGVAVVTAQGALAVYQIGAVVAQGRAMFDAMPNVFLPLAIISLFRLLPARWLAYDFAFQNASDMDAIPLCDLDEPEDIENGHNHQQEQGEEAGELESQLSASALILRTLFMAALLGVFVGQIFHILEWPHGHFTVAAVSEHLLYHTLIATALAIYSFHLVRGEADSTVLPSINSLWFTVYTIAWYLMAVYVIVVNGMETRRTYCGIYTTLSPSAGQDASLCAGFS